MSALVKIRNINPLGQVDLPLVGRQGVDYLGEHGIGNLEPDEVFEVTPEHAAILLTQTGNYEPADDAAKAIAAEVAAPVEKPARASRPRATRPRTSRPRTSRPRKTVEKVAE